MSAIQLSDIAHGIIDIMAVPAFAYVLTIYIHMLTRGSADDAETDTGAEAPHPDVLALSEAGER